MSTYDLGPESPDPLLAWVPLTWRERAARVRAGDAAAADEPAEVGMALMGGLFDTILRRSFDAVVLCDRTSGEYLEVSDSFCRLTGYARAELLGRTSVELGMVDPSGLRRAIEADVARGYEGMYEDTITRHDGQEVVVEFTHSFLQDEYTLVVARDVTARKLREAQLERHARIDELTGVLNRRGFREDLDVALATAADTGAELHVLVADADGLKPINDELGHEYGDQLLISIALLLRAATSPYGVVGRLGGDEFAAFFSFGTPREAAEMLGRLGIAMRRRSVGPTLRERPVSASIGLASASESGYDAGALLSLADARMYQVKHA